jgi:tocopherol cyclase
MQRGRSVCSLVTLITCSAALRSPPHSGYHMRGRTTGFEGWYTRLTLPDCSFAFIHAICDPANAESPRHGVSTQVVGPGGCEKSPNTPSGTSFWADEHELALGHTITGVPFKKPMSGPAFNRFVDGGFQMTSTLHQGKLPDGSASWCYTVEPRLGWGGDVQNSRQFSTAGWLAALPVFEPHWQVLLAHGLATGHVVWRGERFEFARVPVYAEKNWGGRFPERWFWLQCNSFPARDGCSITMAGGTRGVPVVGKEDVAMIALHTDSDFGGEFGGGESGGGFYPFPNIRWQVGPWDAAWSAEGTFERFRILVEASTAEGDPGVLVDIPTDGGMVSNSRETFSGKLRVRMWRSSSGAEEELLLDLQSEQAALELGGGPWEDQWCGSCEVGSLAREVLAADVPLQLMRDWLPGY